MERVSLVVVASDACEWDVGQRARRIFTFHLRSFDQRPWSQTFWPFRRAEEEASWSAKYIGGRKTDQLILIVQEVAEIHHKGPKTDSRPRLFRETWGKP